MADNNASKGPGTECCNEPITHKDIEIISKNIGRHIRDLDRAMDFEEGEAFNIQSDHRNIGQKEVVVQLLTEWKGKKGPEATCSLLIKILESIDRKDIAEMIKEAHKNEKVKKQNTSPCKQEKCCVSESTDE